jgi:hypothetical protein
MFIDTAVNPKTCAPAERDVSAMVRDTALRFAPPERGGVFYTMARSINITSLRDGKRFRKSC